MINTNKYLDELKFHYSNVLEVRPGIFRLSEDKDGRDYAIRYFDLTGNLSEAADHLQEYQEDLLTETFFDSNFPTDLRWNHYLYFVSDENPSTCSSFNENKKKIEADRTYARKHVISGEELKAILTPKSRSQISQPVDIINQWTQRLDQLDLSFILDDSITSSEIAKYIRDHKKPPLTIVNNASKLSDIDTKLSEAEVTAAKAFLKILTISNFRDYPTKQRFKFGKVNLIFGRNGAGKTSLLEAIEFLYCGENRRVNELTNATHVEGEFFSSDNILTTTSKILTKTQVLRNSVWYAKADLRKPTLANSFSKFNFLDTDAAANLSKENDSDDRLRTDLVRLLHGTEVVRTLKHVEQVEKKLGELLRISKYEAERTEEKLADQQGRLLEIKNSPKDSDNLFLSLNFFLKKLSWSKIPESKNEAIQILEPLNLLDSSVRQIIKSGVFDSKNGLELLNQLNRQLSESLASAESIFNKIQDIRSVQFESTQKNNDIQKKMVILETLERYANAEFTLKLEELNTLRIKTNKTGERLALLENAQDDLVTFIHTTLSLDQARKTSDQTVLSIEAKLHDQRILVESIEENMSSTNVLKQNLMLMATELLNKVSDKNHCPVCRTQFDDEQLKLRMVLTNDSEGNKVLETALLNLTQLQEQLARAKVIHTALNKLSSFFDFEGEFTIKEALEIVKDTSVSLEKNRNTISEIDNVVKQFGIDGLTESDLYRQLSLINLDKLPNVDQLISLKKDYFGQTAQLRQSITSCESNLNELQIEFFNLVGAETKESIIPGTVSISMLEPLRERLARVATDISAYHSILPFFNSTITSSDHIDSLALAQANDALNRLLTQLEREAQNLSAAQEVEKNITNLIEMCTEFTEKNELMTKAFSLISELNKQSNTGEFSNTILSVNAATIGEIFRAIHSPTEFTVTVENNNLEIIRERTKNTVSLNQMSTGQRAAYALSLFLTLNRNLILGPPLILLDDPVAHVDDLNILSFLDYLRDIAISGERQIFFATADEKLAGLFRQKFRFLGPDDFCEISLERS